MPKREICGYLKPNTVTTNDNLCNSSTDASKNNDNDKNTGGTETVANTGTNMVTPNDEGNNGEEAEAEAATNSAKSNSNNNGIGSSNNKSNCVDTKILKRLDKNENKKLGNNVGFNGDNPSETRDSQQQKCGNTMLIANNRS